MRLLKIQIGRPQRLAALLLLMFLAQCLWVVHHQELSEHDYRYARCGREMWERPSPLAGYFTTCGNLGGDGSSLRGNVMWVCLSACKDLKKQADYQ